MIPEAVMILNYNAFSFPENAFAEVVCHAVVPRVLVRGLLPAGRKSADAKKRQEARNDDDRVLAILHSFSSVIRMILKPWDGKGDAAFTCFYYNTVAPYLQGFRSRSGKGL